jgi:hypothetical protein
MVRDILHSMLSQWMEEIKPLLDEFVQFRAKKVALHCQCRANTTQCSTRLFRRTTRSPSRVSNSPDLSPSDCDLFAKVKRSQQCFQRLSKLDRTCRKDDIYQFAILPWLHTCPCFTLDLFSLIVSSFLGHPIFVCPSAEVDIQSTIRRVGPSF